jgi:hypothetical protein
VGEREERKETKRKGCKKIELFFLMKKKHGNKL